MIFYVLFLNKLGGWWISGDFVVLFPCSNDHLYTQNRNFKANLKYFSNITMINKKICENFNKIEKRTHPCEASSLI
jgi:hypothetical protein